SDFGRWLVKSNESAAPLLTLLPPSFSAPPLNSDLDFLLFIFSGSSVFSGFLLPISKMSILGSMSNNGSSRGSPFFHEFKKQASFFFKEKIKTARLVLTDVTPAQLLAEEATNGNPWAPDARTLKIISKAAFEIDDYWRIVEILHKRLARFVRKNWRLSYKALLVLEHLLTHGPESVAEEFEDDKYVIIMMKTFQHVDEKGFNWGLNVQKKCERVLKLLERGPLLKEERDRARKITRGIEGFGSFCQRTSERGTIGDAGLEQYGRSNSQFNDHGDQEEKEEDVSVTTKKTENSNLPKGSAESTGELKPFRGGQKNKSRRVGMAEEESHPFNEPEFQATESLLPSADKLLQAR
ncbi:unnamed protein product, partial [Thlaspi arvense]